MSADSMFPRTIALAGRTDIRDCLRRARRESPGPGVPFNIVKESLTLPNFTPDEIKTLYGQHTEAGGQVFEESAITRAWFWTKGQPRLVNALANEVVVAKSARYNSFTVTGGMMDEAAEGLLRRQDAHG